MNFEDLLKNKLIEKYEVPNKEIEAILEASKSDLKTAHELLNTDICWAFNIAYNSILEAGIALMYTKGFRPIGEAKHVSVILFLRRALGKEYETELNRFDQMRRKRNKAVYGVLRNITEYEARDSAEFAEGFVEELIKIVHKDCTSGEAED